MEKLKVLIAESEDPNLDKLREVLEKDDYDVMSATDGVQALQFALHHQPSFILLSLDLPFIDGVKLSQIVRTNPKTENIPIFFINDRLVQISHFRKNSDYFLIKPFNVDEVRKILNNTRKKLMEVQQMTKEEEFSGNLKQLPLPDLLQVLSMNRRTGNLELVYGQEEKERKALISILEGKVINAKLEKAGKAKAFYRILMHKEGRFRFTPGNPELKEEIEDDTNNLLMEGLRQLDELAEMIKKLPSNNIKVYLNVALSEVPKGLRPNTMEVLSAVEVFPDIKDLLDNIEIHDYEILKILLGLREKNLVRIEEGSKEEKAVKADFSSDAVLELKKTLNKIYPGLKSPYNISIALFFENATFANNFIRALSDFSFIPARGELMKLKKGDRRIGLLGTVKVVETLRTNLVYFNGVAPSKPLMNSFMHMSIGAMVFGNREPFREALNTYGKRFAGFGPKDAINMESVKKALEKIFDAFIRENM